MNRTGQEAFSWPVLFAVAFTFIFAAMAEKKNTKAGFQKFAKNKLTGAAKKEAFKQEKREAKKETADFFRKKKEQNTGKPSTTPKTDKEQKPQPAPTAQPREIQKKNTLVLKGKAAAAADDTIMPLNKFLAWGGVCSRRDAAEMIKEGKVKVNGKIELAPGYKVQPGDQVWANGKQVVQKMNLVYILLNKPKDFITTTEDDSGRKTVLDIVKNATTERIYPVGRLDRNTTGVLLLTNDGNLAQQLTHPKFEIKKIYEAHLDKDLTKADLDKLVQGLELEDGFIAADSAAYAHPTDKKIIGIEIHSGRNRIVRRMFEHLGYDVKNLDRVMFANLTKKNVDRGKWRFLSEREIRLLKYFNKSKK